ncbi:flavocytochrome c [Gottschalkiaceae bacterium SANA]|nr:flavocytochrome c [Gottschalkiaceae bacterium SANA]
MNKENIRWHHTVDVLVVGTGFAGLSAAIEASIHDADVLIIEKMHSYGGNSIISDGGIAAPNTCLQKKEGIQDNEALMYQDMLHAGLGLNFPNLLHTLVANAKDAFQWTIDELQVPYIDRVDQFGGHSVARCYTPERKSGATMIKRMIQKTKSLGIPIHYCTSFQSFIVDDEGKIIGASLLDQYDYKKKTGIVKNVKTKKGVILATGGYGADVPFRQLQDPRLTAEIDTTNKPFATAEALKAALAIHASAVQLSQIQLGAWSSPDEKGYGDGPLFADYILFQYGVIINPKNAKRIVNELGDRKIISDALLSLGHPCVGIADHHAVQHAGWDLTRAMKKGVVKTFSSLDDLAAYYALNSLDLQDTIHTFNQYVESGLDPDFGKMIVKDAAPIQEPPFYAMKLWPKVHFVMGGLGITEKAQVLDYHGHVIEGLYAAGEVAGGVHGASRLGSCAVTECIVFGRIAGQEVCSK